MQIGDTVRYYDAVMDEFRNGPLIFIHEGWALVGKPPEPPRMVPFAPVELAALRVADLNPLAVGDAVVCPGRFGATGPGTIVAADGAQAWVRWEQGDSIEALNRLERA